MPGAAEALTGDVDVKSLVAWRDFMVSSYDDAGGQKWADSVGIEVLRGTGRLVGPHTVAVDGRTYTADHVIIATGAEAIIPPVPGLRELDGLWTNREATGFTEVPRSLILLGGGATGVEMAQVFARLGAAVTLVEGNVHLLAREPLALGSAVSQALVADGVDLRLGQHASAARFDGGYVLEFPDGTEVRGEKLLVATGRRPRVDGIGLETVGIEPNPRGITVDPHMSAGDGLWAIGDVTGLWQLTHAGKYQARVAAANILGQDRTANYEAMPRVIFTDPQAAAVGAAEGPFTATISLSVVARTATYTRAYDTQPGFLTLVSDGERLTGAHAAGPEAGEWLQQATLAIRARTPLSVLLDVVQPFPTFSEAYLQVLQQLHATIVGPVSSA